MAHYTDAQAKAILRDRRYWPARTQQWGVAKSGEFWIRSRPSDVVNNKRPLPKLVLPGADLFSTQPDGMWCCFRGTTCVDVIAVEVCGSMPNLNDKRSRYISTGTGLMLNAPAKWFYHLIGLQNGGAKPIWEASGCLTQGALPTSGTLKIPVRLLRTLFVIPDAKYGSWVKNHVPAGHEFFMKHSTLKSGNGPRAKVFLGGMSWNAHFCTLG